MKLCLIWKKLFAKMETVIGFNRNNKTMIIKINGKEENIEESDIVDKTTV